MIEDSVDATGQLFRPRTSRSTCVPERVPPVHADRDRLVQVLINLLSNAAKFVEADAGRVSVGSSGDADAMRVA